MSQRNSVRTHLLAIALTGFAICACSSQAATSTYSTNGAAPMSTITSTDPCTGIDGCREVATVDVDGDGALDRVGVATTQQLPPSHNVAVGEATVTVAVAVQSTVSRIDVNSPGLLPGFDSFPQPYVGAYRISRTNGADLVLHTKMGQGAPEQFAVIGWKDRRPILVDRPPAEADDSRSASVWYIGSSHGIREWVTCSDGAAVTMNRLSAAVAEGLPVPGGGIREENLFVFEGDSWLPNGSRNIADNNFSYDYDPHTQTFQCEDQALH